MGIVNLYDSDAHALWLLVFPASIVCYLKATGPTLSQHIPSPLPTSMDIAIADFILLQFISNCLFSSAKMKLNPASLISQECKRKDEDITPTQYPTISGFSLAIFSVNGGIQLREMIEACTLPCKSVTVERWHAKKKYTMKFLNFCHTKLTPNQLYVLTCSMAHFPSPLPTSMDTAIAEFQSTSISLSAIVFSLNSSYHSPRLLPHSNCLS